MCVCSPHAPYCYLASTTHFLEGTPVRKLDLSNTVLFQKGAGRTALSPTSSDTPFE